jgi:flavin-dependent dehydrogenase
LEDRDVIVVGAGPAGSAVAAGLVRLDAEFASRLLVLERAHHPRPKLCGGGVTRRGERALRRLGLDVDVPSVWIDRIRFYANDSPTTIDRPARLRIVRRDEFDAALAARVREMGVEIREGVEVQCLQRDRDRIVLETSAGTYRARVVVGADGAKGTVRASLVREARDRVCRLIEVLVPVGDDCPEHRRRMAVFDFRGLRSSLQGYLWDFPCLVGGKPHLNIGVFDSRIRDGRRAAMKDLLRARLAARGIDMEGTKLLGHPARWYGKGGRYSAPNVLLVGDAAGVDPLLCEGIAFALAYGPVAADAIVDAFRHEDFSFADYGMRIRRSGMGRTLDRLHLAARWAYSPWTRPLLAPALRLLASRISKPPPFTPTPR